MAVGIEEISVRSGDHLVQFYEHDSELYGTVGRYLIDAVRGGAVAIVIATEAHRRAFEAELKAVGIDPLGSRRNGTLVLLDAAATMASFMPGGRIDGAAFHRVIGAVVREAANTGKPVRAYGEMVALLWDAGDVLAAIELEKLWNDLGRELQFSLLCAYHSESVAASEDADSLQQVCELHSSVLHAPIRDDPRRGIRDLACPEVSGQFPAESDAPRAARRFIADACGRWGHGGTFLDDAKLVVSELATNAVVHARSSFSVVARAGASGVRVSVRDASPVAPTLRDDGPAAASGRGLRLVAAIAADWGVELTADGKTVWAQLEP